MIMKMRYSMLSIGPRGNCWNGASGALGVCELGAVSDLEPWTSLWGREIKGCFVIFSQCFKGNK